MAAEPLTAADLQAITVRMVHANLDGLQRAELALQLAQMLSDRELTLCIAFKVEPAHFLFTRVAAEEEATRLAEAQAAAAENEAALGARVGEVEAYYAALGRGESPPRPW